MYKINILLKNISLKIILKKTTNTLIVTKLIVLVFAFGSISSVFATDFYCDPINGNNSNLGNKSNPWGSLESVFKDGKQFGEGDVIYLMEGSHGNVEITGDNSKYIKIIGLDKEKSRINSIVFGTDILKASKWIVSNVSVNGKSKKELVIIHKNSSKIRLLSNEIFGIHENSKGVKIDGDNCKIENNIIHNISTGIIISSVKNQVRNNIIENFYQNAIEISGNYNLLEYNLIRKSKAVKENTAIYIHPSSVKGVIIRGNTIINFIKPRKNEISLMNGIFGKKITFSEGVIENNTIISNGVNGIFFSGEINNTKIVNNTVVNPYFGLEFDGSTDTNTQLSIVIKGFDKSSNLIVQNNLVNNIVFEKVKGLADHNLILPVDVHQYDLCFKNWALFDFSLSENSKALNKGSVEFVPKLDASLNKRPLGSFVNIGAFEFSKVNDANETYKITTEISDRQVHSKGKSDWDGQPKIRVGGSGEGIDGAGVFPFKLPLIQGGKEIISANFTVNLSTIDNNPGGSVDVYGLPPKSNFWVTDDMFYQGTFGQDLKARPIQNEFVDSNTITGTTVLNAKGKVGLKNYLSTIYENGAKAGDFIFLRLNPSSKDVTDYHRWSFISGNTDKENKKPFLEIVAGYPNSNNRLGRKVNPLKNVIVSSPSPINSGNFSLYFLRFDDKVTTEVVIFSYKGVELFRKKIQNSTLTDNVFRSEGLSLPVGKYFLQYVVGNETKKQPIYIW